MTTLTLNIGLDTNTGESLSINDVLQYLTGNGFFIRSFTLEQSSTEETLIVIVDPVPASRIYQASIDLKQDCIAVSPDNGKTGALIGPRADAWGWSFKPAFFIASN